MNKEEFFQYVVDFRSKIAELVVFPRDKGIKKLTKDFVFTIIGPRRAGKTYFLYNIIKGLKEDFLYINFDDLLFEGLSSKEVLDLIALYESRFGVKPAYLFFDEIQELDDWERLIYTLYERKEFFIFITGSNARLLSKEIATALRGRTLVVEILPFSFKEFLGFKGFEFNGLLTSSQINKIKFLLEDYLKTGGFVDLIKNIEFRDEFLNDYFDLIIFKDLVERFKISNIGVLKYLAKYLINNVGGIVSINKLFNDLKSQGVTVSKKTLYNYFEFLSDVYLSLLVKKKSGSLRESRRAGMKNYLYNFALCRSNSLRSKIFENLVALELRRRGFEFYFYKNHSEIDFVTDNLCIQVSMIEKLEELPSRELKAFKMIDCKEKIVLTYDYEGIVDGVKFIPLWKWLLR